MTHSESQPQSPEDGQGDHSDDEHPLGASASPPREPGCRFRTVKHYFDGPVIARCTSCARLIAIDEIGDQYITMPCGETWAINLRSILQSRS